MTDYEISILELAPAGIEELVAGRPIPTPSHCVGTGKLLGALLGKSIAEECEINDVSVELSLTELCCMLRSYIVIDDFVKDAGVDIKDFPGIELWLLGIEDRCIELISDFLHDPISIWSRYIDIYRMAYDSFDFSGSFKSVIEKCNLIFLPFELEPFVSHHRCHKMLESMKNYLFALQLVDDFQDMEEDSKAPKNHNLFVGGLSQELSDVVMKGRWLFARTLFTYIEKNVLSIRNNIYGRTALATINHSLFWINEKKKELKEFPMIECFKGQFRDYKLNIVGLKETFLKAPHFSIPFMEEIRAENMHTVTIEET